MILGSAAKQKASSALERIEEQVERHAGAGMVVLLCLLFVALVGLAASDYLWYDELIVIRVAALSHWQDIWNFYASGLDTIGLLYALVLHALRKLPADEEIRSRLPAIVSFLGMLWCTFVFVRRRYAAVYAFATVLLLTTAPLLDMAVFAKSYAVELAGLAFAMICWQKGLEESSGWGAVGVWCGLAIAISSHTFAIFLVVPFAAAQWWADARRGRVTWEMWAALVLFPVALLPVLPGALKASKLYGSNFWSKPSAALMKKTYIDYFMTNWRFLVILLIAGLIVSLVLADRKSAEELPERTRGFSGPEWVLVGLLTALPVYVLPVSYLLHAYRGDYVLGYAIGLGILLVALFAEQSRRTGAAGLVVLILFAAVTLKVDLKTMPGGVRALVHPRSVHAALAEKYNSEPWVKLLAGSDLPVLAGDHLLYTRLDYYAPPDLSRRLYFLTDFAEVSKYPLSETSQRNFLLFGRLLGYQTMDVGGFVPEHREFLMAVKDASGASWLEPYMLKQQEQGNATLQFLGPDVELPSVFDVRFSRVPEVPVAKTLTP